MKKVISFKKEMLFNNNVFEITSISLEHSLQVSDNNFISGIFYINGEYKISDISINTEVFKFDLPCDINLDSKYILDNVKIEIDDFYYEVVDSSILKVNIDVLIDNLEEREQIINEDIAPNLIKNTSLEELENNLEEDNVKELVQERCIEDEDISNVKSVFGNFKDNTETYKTYKVYIVREGDNLDNIIQKYNITKEMLEKYNNLNEINLGDKIIIPSLINEKD